MFHFLILFHGIGVLGIRNLKTEKYVLRDSWEFLFPSCQWINGECQIMAVTLGPSRQLGSVWKKHFVPILRVMKLIVVYDINNDEMELKALLYLSTSHEKWQFKNNYTNTSNEHGTSKSFSSSGLIFNQEESNFLSFFNWKLLTFNVLMIKHFCIIKDKILGLLKIPT